MDSTAVDDRCRLDEPQTAVGHVRQITHDALAGRPVQVCEEFGVLLRHKTTFTYLIKHLIWGAENIPCEITQT